MITQRRASLCRTTLVTASRTTYPNSSLVASGIGSTAVGVTGSIPAAASTERALAISAATRTSRIPDAVARTSARDCRAMTRQLGDLGLRRRRVPVDQLLGQVGLDRDGGQRMAEDVVQVAADPFPLGDQRQRRDPLLGPVQPGADPARLDPGPGGEPDHGPDQRDEQRCAVRADVATAAMATLTATMAIRAWRQGIRVAIMIET